MTTASWRRSPAACRDWPSRPMRCTSPSTTTAATTRPRPRSASAPYWVRRPQARSSSASDQLEPDARGGAVLSDAPALREPFDEEQPPAALVVAGRPIGIRIEAGALVGHLGDYRRAADD